MSVQTVRFGTGAKQATTVAEKIRALFAEWLPSQTDEVPGPSSCTIVGRYRA